MADVRLDFYDVDAEALPDVCMKCGAPPVVRPMKRFSWMPPWARWMPPIIAVWFVKRRTVPIPLCEQHKNHWTLRYLIGFGGLALFLLLLFGGIFMLAASTGPGNGDEPGVVVGGLMLALAGVAFLAWLITMIVLAVTAIGVFEITDDDITLKNVSLEFADAYRAQTRGGVVPDVDDMGRRGWAGPARGADPRRPRRPDLPPDDKYQRG